jgi:tRNA 2-thiocytidine biosynthesis protein TtcA
VKKMIRDWERQYPGRIDNMMTAMGKVVPSHLMDAKLFPFATLKTTGVPSPDGDIAFDDEPCSAPTSPSTSTPLNSPLASTTVRWHRI